MRVILIGLGVSADAAAVAAADGMSDRNMSFKKIAVISLTFGAFQGLMPFFGFLAGYIFAAYIRALTPYIALFLLGFTGIKMIAQANAVGELPPSKIGRGELLSQAVATSIDALAVGVLFVNMTLLNAVLCFALIAAITFAVCLVSVYIGKKFGAVFKSKAQIAGGIVLILLGLKIFFDHVF